MRTLAFLLIAAPALAQPAPQRVDPWPTILSLRGRLLEIYGADRDRCLATKDDGSEACVRAHNELGAIQQIDAQIASVQKALSR